MDEQLATELDRRFDHLHHEMGSKFQNVHQRIDDNSQKIEANSQKVEENGRKIEANSRKIEESSRKIDEHRTETSQRFDALDQRLDGMDARIRHTNVVVEDLRSDVQVIAEGVSGLNHKLDRFIEDSETKRQEDRALMVAGFKALNERDDDLDRRLRRVEAIVVRADFTGT